MYPPGYTCLADIAPLTIEIQRGNDCLWNMVLFDQGGNYRVVMPPSEYGLDEAKEKALINAERYMRKWGGDPAWNSPASVEWREFTPSSVIWET